MVDYTVQQINSMNSVDLKQAALSLGVDSNGLSDVALRTQLDDKIQSTLNGTSTSLASTTGTTSSTTSSPINLINGKNPEAIAKLQKEYDDSTVAMNESKDSKNQYSDIFTQAKATYGQTDPKNSSLVDSQNNYNLALNDYTTKDNRNTFLNTQLFSALT